ncbi:MAG: tetratricopeptide repeat protein [Flavobacteriales bacterium]
MTVMRTFLTLGLLSATLASSAQSLQDAIKLTDKEQFDKATAAFKAAIAASPQNGEAWFYLGENYFANDRTDSAEYAYRKGIEVNPRFPLNHAGLGKVLRAKGQKDQANAQFTEAIAAATDKAAKNPKQLIGATYREVAEGLMEGSDKDYAAIQADLDKAIELDPKNVEAYILKGDAYFDANPRDGTTPLENYKKAMNVDALNAKPVARKGFMYYRAKNFGSAIEEYSNAIKIDPMYAPAYSGRAEAYYMSRDFDKATADMNKYLELNSGNTSARVRNAQFLFLVKKYPESLREIDALQAQGVKNVVLQRIRAYDLVEQGDTVNAIPAFDAYFAEQAKEKVISSDLEYYGKALALQHEDSLAGEKFLEAARMDRTKDHLFIEAGKAFSKARAYDSAINAYREKMKTGKLEVNDWYYLGNAANKARRYTMADSAWAEYIVKQPNIYQGYLYRARAQAGLDSAEVKTWAAKPYYEDVIRKMKPEEQAKAKADLEEAYNYMGLYYLYSKADMDRAKAKCFFEKVSALGANTSITKQVNETFLKMKELKDVTPSGCDVL